MKNQKIHKNEKIRKSIKMKNQKIHKNEKIRKSIKAGNKTPIF
jgi:ADP-glucose pyrophosphorylase